MVVLPLLLLLLLAAAPAPSAAAAGALHTGGGGGGGGATRLATHAHRARADRLPTHPPSPTPRLQVFVRGEFVGGADLLYEMHQKGELRDVLQGGEGGSGGGGK